jgi:hypothetical protein
MPTLIKLASVIALAGLAGCATAPTGPRVMVLPGTGMSFDAFRADEAACRYYAHEQVNGMTPSRVAEDSAVRSAAAGAALGAVAGAAIDGSSGAGTGAGIGLLFGGLLGADAAQRSSFDAQRRYDIAYQQCMYAKGHQVPVAGRYSAAPRAPQARHYPPPPPNQPPPR